MARVAGQGAVALEGSDGGVPDVIGNQRGNRSRNHLSDRSAWNDLRPYWRTSPVDGIDDEVADMTGAPEALGATPSEHRDHRGDRRWGCRGS